MRAKLKGIRDYVFQVFSKNVLTAIDTETSMAKYNTYVICGPDTVSTHCTNRPRRNVQACR